jgi:hypothetical protein
MSSSFTPKLMYHHYGLTITADYALQLWNPRTYINTSRIQLVLRNHNTTPTLECTMLKEDSRGSWFVQLASHTI